MSPDLLSMLQALLPAVGLYAAIRSDIAAMHVRLDHIERDLYGPKTKAPAP